MGSGRTASTHAIPSSPYLHGPQATRRQDDGPGDGQEVRRTQHGSTEIYAVWHYVRGAANTIAYSLSRHEGINRSTGSTGQVVPVAAGHGRRPPESPDTEHIRARQLDDNTAAIVLCKISRAIEGSTKNDPVAVRSHTLPFMVATWGGVLQIQEEEDGRHRGFHKFVPASMRREVMTATHAGRNLTKPHLDRQCSYNRLVANDHWWPSVSPDLNQFFDDCTVCRSEPECTMRGPAARDMTPHKTVQVTIFGLFTDMGGTSFVLCITDALTLHLHLQMMQSTRPEEIAGAIFRYSMT